MKKILIMLTLVILVFSCASNPKPKWWRSQPKDSNYIYVYGKSNYPEETAGIESAKSMAYNNAAQYVENYLKSMTKDWLQVTGSGDPYTGKSLERVIKQTSEKKLSGGMVTKDKVEKTDEGYTTWVQVRIPAEILQGSFIDHIRSEKSLYDEMKKIKAFKELEGEFHKK